MSNPVIADNKPVKVTLSKGQEYHFCTCGRSRSQPFCDGSHGGTEFTPRVIVSDEDQEAFLCACKYTQNPPFCDGTHAIVGGLDIDERRFDDTSHRQSAEQTWHDVSVAVDGEAAGMPGPRSRTSR